MENNSSTLPVNIKNESEKLLKSLHCGRCHKTYPNEYNYTCNQCKVCHMCAICYHGRNSGSSRICLTCNAKTKWKLTRVKIDSNQFLQLVVATSRKSYEVERENQQLKTENSMLKMRHKEWENVLSVFKRRQEEWESLQKDHHKCVECTTMESEQNMQLCATCHEITLNNLEEHVLCSACAIKKHIRKGHQTVDFYPYLRAVNFNSILPQMKSESDSLRNSWFLLNITFNKFKDLSKNASENFDALTDMARRSNSTENQQEFFRKMKIYVNESKSVHVNANNDFKKHTDILAKNLENLKIWCEEKAGNCVDDSETIKDI